MGRWVLLAALPLAFLGERAGLPGVVVFFLAALSLLPLAGWMGEATEAIAARTSPALGGLLNATFGNAAELIIAAVALAAGHVEVVKASITGSILGNVLLVLGLAVLLGGLRYPEQRFSTETAGHLATLLTLSLLAFALPAIFDLAERSYFRAADPHAADLRYSLAAAGVLIASYFASLWYALVTHRDLFRSEAPAHGPDWPLAKAVPVLLFSTLGVVAGSELLVRHLEAATHALGVSPFFVGIVLVPLVGNAAEHMAAVAFALKDRIDLSVEIAVGSSIQIALLVAPLLVFLGLVLGQPFDLVFENPLELAALAATVLIANSVLRDGRTRWLEGVLLLGVYALLALAFLLV